jgi:hypothetical protein
MGEPTVSQLSEALVAVANAGNIVGQVFEDKVVNFKDLGVIIAGLGSLSGLASINFPAALDEAGKLTEGARANAVAAFKAAFEIPEEGAEEFLEAALDAALTALLAFVKAKDALGRLVPKLKAA